jgi:16S rRNA (guanine527-N7)-methyltransferase
MFHVKHGSGSAGDSRWEPLAVNLLRHLSAAGEGVERRLRTYVAALEGLGRERGAVGPSVKGEVAWRHMAESLAAALVRRPREGEKWVDVGSGAGLPGIVLAIAFPATGFSLVEPSRRKATFLHSVVAKLALGNAEVIQERAEVLARGGQRESWDVALARALAPPSESLELCLPLVRLGGEALVWLRCGMRVGVLEAEGLGAGRYEVVWPLLQWGVEGGILQVEKVRPALEIYPRASAARKRKPAVLVLEAKEGPRVSHPGAI